MTSNPLPAFWPGATQDQRDAAYDNGRACPDSPALIAERNAASEAFRAAHPGHLDLAYGTTERQGWDLYPAADPSAPCLVFIHGGYWMRNRRQDFAVMAEGALARGWSAALPGYDLVPDVTLTDIVGQIDAALTWLQANGKAHGIAGPVILSGWSAGGHLVGATAAHPVVAVALPMSGIFELAPIRDTYLNDKARLMEAEIVTLSPQRLPMVRKPMAVAYGSAELPELCRQSRDFHAARAAAHCPGPLIPVAGADHFRMLDALRHPDGELLRAAAELLRYPA